MNPSNQKAYGLAICASAGLLVVSLFGFLLGESQFGRQPIDERLTAQDVNFGESWENAAMMHAIRLVNSSDEQLNVLDLNATCSCTKVEPLAFSVPAHGTQVVTLTIDTRESEEVGTIRPFSIRLTPRVDGFDTSHSGWNITGIVKKPVTWDPPELVLDETVRRPGIWTQEIRVSAAQPLAQFDFASHSDGISESVVSPIDSQDGPQEYSVRFRLSDDLPLGPFALRPEFRVTLEGSGEQQTARYSIVGSMRHELKANPPAVVFNGHPGLERQALAIQSRLERHVSLTVDDDGLPSGVTVQYSNSPGNEQLLWLECARRPEGLISGELKVWIEGQYGDGPLSIPVCSVGSLATPNQRDNIH